MARFRKVRKWGNSLVVLLQYSDVHDLNVKEGDWVDMEDALMNKSLPPELVEQEK